MSHHLIRYSQHVRREFKRVLEGMSEADCNKRVANLNSIAWMTAHLMNQEYTYWHKSQANEIAEVTAFNETLKVHPADFKEAFVLWERVTDESNDWLERLSEDDLRTHLTGRKSFEVENIGSLLTRVIGHYYFHIGQISAVRKMLDYDVPGFVGSQEGAYFD